MIKFKPGVKFFREHNGVIHFVQPETFQAMAEAEKVMELMGKECVVTSVCEGSHSPTSLHYVGYAADFRTRHLTLDEKSRFLSAMRDRLGDDYDIILEKTHLHVEFDPD